MPLNPEGLHALILDPKLYAKHEALNTEPQPHTLNPKPLNKYSPKPYRPYSALI